jgi:hypothetical protein
VGPIIHRNTNVYISFYTTRRHYDRRIQRNGLRTTIRGFFRQKEKIMTYKTPGTRINKLESGLLSESEATQLTHTNNPDIDVLMAQFVQIDASDAKYGSQPMAKPNNVVQLKPQHKVQRELNQHILLEKHDRPDMDLSAVSEEILNLRAELLVLMGDASIPPTIKLKLRHKLILMNVKTDDILAYLADQIQDLSLAQSQE